MPRNPLFVGVGFILLISGHTASGQKYELRLPDNAAVRRSDFEQNDLNGHLLLAHRDFRLTAGQIGLSTKSDSVTAFDDLQVRFYQSK